MIKAVVKNGVVVPRDPLPQDWREGTEVDVEKSSADLSDTDMRLQQAIDEERRLAKDLARQGKM